MKRTVICYKVKEAEIVNKGTKYETSLGDTFLGWYTYKTREEAEAEVAKINVEHPERDFTGRKVNWDKVAYYFVDEQEEMY